MTFHRIFRMMINIRWTLNNIKINTWAKIVIMVIKIKIKIKIRIKIKINNNNNKIIIYLKNINKILIKIIKMIKLSKLVIILIFLIKN
jgi:hypothetical protein